MTISSIVYFLVGIALILASPLWSTKIALNFTKLASNYGYNITLNHTENNRFSFNEDWSGDTISSSNITNVTEKSTESTSLINSTFQVKSITGDVLFDLNQKFNVNRYTNHNLPGESDITGSSYYMFPKHVQKKDYLYWPGTFGKPFLMKYIKTETIGGLSVFLFQGQDNSLDDTKGYEFLPLVPEKYSALSKATLDVYVEPVSGMIIDYKDKGISYYSDGEKHRLWDIAQWSNEIKPESTKLMITMANAVRNKIILHEIVIPGSLFLIGAFFIYKSVSRRAGE